MIDFRQHKDLIKSLIAEESAKDKNWRWSMNSIGKSKVSIEWGYLIGLDPKTCFFITTETDDCLGDIITWRHPGGEMMSFATIGTRPGDNARTVEEAIKMAVHGISYYAHTRY